jgi:hypothetical protein
MAESPATPVVAAPTLKTPKNREQKKRPQEGSSRGRSSRNPCPPPPGLLLCLCQVMLGAHALQNAVTLSRPRRAWPSSTCTEFRHAKRQKDQNHPPKSGMPYLVVTVFPEGVSATAIESKEEARVLASKKTRKVEFQEASLGPRERERDAIPTTMNYCAPATVFGGPRAMYDHPQFFKGALQLSEAGNIRQLLDMA